MKTFTEEGRAVAEALQPKLGLRLASAVAECCADEIRGGMNRNRTLDLLAHRVEEALLKRLYQALGDGMVFRREDGVFLRIGTEDIPDLADDVMAVLMQRMPVSPQSYDLLREYAWRTGSPAAMRTLMTLYAGTLPAKDR